MNQQHVHDALNKSAGDMEHYMSEYGLKALPELARRPIAVIKSKTHPDTSVVAILDGTVNGKQLIAAIRIGEEKNINGENYSVNIVASAYGKNKAVENMLTDAINQFNQNGEGVYYIDTQKARQLFTRAGVQFPWSSSQNGLIQNITDKASPVNQKLIIQQTNTPQFKRWFGNSKVKNTNGTPRILYHQTNKEFSTFDRMRVGEGAGDSETPHGVFMKPTNDDIGLGNNQMALYARIEKPLTLKNREEANAWYRQHIPGYAEADDELKSLDKKYDAEYSAVEKEGDDWYFENYDDYVAGKFTEDEFQAGTKFAELDTILEKWHTEEDEKRKALKKMLDDFFFQSEYDGIHLIEDKGSRGRSVETSIAFDENQVKSADRNTGSFPETIITFIIPSARTRAPGRRSGRRKACGATRNCTPRRGRMRT